MTDLLNKSSQSYEASLVIWDHSHHCTVLPWATR